jgi:hypothetical protein
LETAGFWANRTLPDNGAVGGNANVFPDYYRDEGCEKSGVEVLREASVAIQCKALTADFDEPFTLETAATTGRWGGGSSRITF